MNLIVRGIALPLSYTKESLLDAVHKKCGVQVRAVRVLRRAVDARKKSDVHFVFNVEADVIARPKRFSDDIKPAPSPEKLPRIAYTLPRRPLVVGAGPAGLFAALTLARAGVCPIVCERGLPVEQRTRTVNAFFDGGALNPDSNVQFGEGGAGTFSDGKLATGISDPRCESVLRDFVGCGAPEDILWDAKPHIGTDRLPGVVAGLRREIEALGGTFLYETKLLRLRIQNERVIAAVAERHGECIEIPTDTVLLAPGHSARDTFAMLHALGVALIPKSFSVGARVEHLQSFVDTAQYGGFAGHPALGAADYKLSAHLPNGRGVYTFCMCPGGTVVAAASEEGHIVTNGMSVYARDGENANAAVLVSVNPEDFPSRDPLAGIAFQRQLERAAFLASNSYRAPAERLGDFLAGLSPSAFGSVRPSYLPGVVPYDLSKVLPSFVCDGMRAGFAAFDRRLYGFAMADAVLTAPETRSSSPVRIARGESCESVSLRGLFPCGEGAGYAGGILSAAVDGIRCAEALLTAYGSPV
ncbi:MAG: hypothetical protein VB111_04440 [Clostridiaceae bacterium]|nr:hypothetical protein [Clostridiaceae bacterium]